MSNTHSFAWLGSVAALLFAGSATAQFSNPGAYTSPVPAGQTTGHNLLFFGNSYTISSTNRLVNTPSYGGARGVPELVRQIAIAAGHPAPFVKNVFHLNKGLDNHLNPSRKSLRNIDEPNLQGETWDFVVMQGFSTRPTHHPFTGNSALLRHNAPMLFDEVRAGSTGHTLKSPTVIPVLYQTWARATDHWFYDVTSKRRGGNNIATGVSNWTGPQLFRDAAEMAGEVRAGYEEARKAIDVSAGRAVARIAPAGDAWEHADWGRNFVNLYSGDHYHANSNGDLLTALSIYGAIYKDHQTSSIVGNASFAAVLQAIGVTAADALALAVHADAVLVDAPIAAPIQRPRSAVLIDCSAAAGAIAGPETRPIPGRVYNTLSDPLAGTIANALDTEGRTTGIQVRVTDAFAGETSGGANGGFIGATNLSGSLYTVLAQRDGFFVGTGGGFADGLGRIKLGGLQSSRSYDLILHGSRASAAFSRVGDYTVNGQVQSLDASSNLNQVLMFRNQSPSATGELTIEVRHQAQPEGFGYINVIELRESVRLEGPVLAGLGATTGLALDAPAFAGMSYLAAASLSAGRIDVGSHSLFLAPDALFFGSFGVAGSPVFSGYVGTLDPLGKSTVGLTLPVLPLLRGLTVYQAAVVLDPSAPFGFSSMSNPHAIRVR